jgi:DNA polymerase III delta prime subunit
MADAIIWTEGKTDAQYLDRARISLAFSRSLDFPVSTDMGDDQLLKQCIALAKAPQSKPNIFVFDRDNLEIASKVSDTDRPFKSWGNNVFSFSIPVPDHRADSEGVCIELYFLDPDLNLQNAEGRRIYLSSEFNQLSGRHLRDASLSVGNKGKLTSGKAIVKVLDTEIFDTKHKNIALSKAEFANLITDGAGVFANVNFSSFEKIFSIFEQILRIDSKDLLFGGMDEYLAGLPTLSKLEKLASIVEAAIRISKLGCMVFTAATIRAYDPAATERLEPDQKRLRPVRQIIIENFATPSLSILVRAARGCYHLIDDRAPDQLQRLRGMMAENPTLDSVGDLLDDIERILPKDGRRGRTIVKRNTKRPLLEYVFSEFAKYEARIDEIRNSESDILEDADDATWIRAIHMLHELLGPLKQLGFREGNIDRLQADSDKFVVRLVSYNNGAANTEEVYRDYADISADRLETFEINVSSHENGTWFDAYPFLAIKNERVHFYTRTRAVGYQYIPAFGDSVHVLQTKRRFSHAALDGTIAADRQMLFWTRVAPAVSSSGVRANIPPHDPTDFVGRKQQISAIMEEIIEITNENGILHGPGGVGKTALLIELSRKIFEEGLPTKAPFKNIIWVSAKRDYYDPTLDVIEEGSQQFKTLDQIFLAILEFHGFEEPDQYSRSEQRWLVLELLEEQKTLLVLDNFETIAVSAQEEIVRFFGTEVKRYLIDKPDNSKVLLTSREVIPSGFHQVQLKGLDKRESNALMPLLYQPYSRSGQPQLTEAQRNQLYEATKGIPLLMKHCYGQVYEYNMPVDSVLKNLIVAGNKVIEFSFAEIFKTLKGDELQRRIIILLEVVNRPILVRQISDILNVEQSSVEARLGKLMNFQCIIRSSSEIHERYCTNPDVRLLATRLVHDSIELTDAIRRDIARLSGEKRMDYNQEELDAIVIFQQHVADGHLAQAEDFIQERLKQRPESIIYNLHYAKFLKEQKRQPVEAIAKLERIRKSSGNDPEVLRLLVLYNIALEPPNFNEAHVFAKELEKYPSNDENIIIDIAEFYTEWATTLKLKIELDPIKEMLRQQKYKELSDHAISLLQEHREITSHRHHYLLAQCFFNKWEYGMAKSSIDRAIDLLPPNSYLDNPYERLRSEVIKKARQYSRRQ